MSDSTPEDPEPREGPRTTPALPVRTGAVAGAGALAIGALGVVFGDIGTSPLYAFREAIDHQNLDVTRTNSLGIASIAFLSLIHI